MADSLDDKKGNTIQEGDIVFTKFRGGKREGEVSYFLPIAVHKSVPVFTCIGARDSHHSGTG